MSAIVAIVLIFLIAAAALGSVAFVVYRRQLRKAKGIERGLKMVPILIHLPPPSDDTTGSNRDVREVMREKTAQAEVLYNLIAGTAQSGFRSQFYGQRHIAFELIATDGLIHFYAAVPVGMVSIVEKAVMTAYPGARLEEVEDHNIFNKEGRIAGTLGGELNLKTNTAYPIATFKTLERDPMEAILNTLSNLQEGDGAGIQIMLRPANPNWVKPSIKLAQHQAKSHMVSGYRARDIALAAFKTPELHESVGGKATDLSNLEKFAIEAIEEKTKHVGYEVLIRIIVSTNSVARSQMLLGDIATSFALFEAPAANGFKFLPSPDAQGLVTAFIFRFFPPEVNTNILNSVELATLFHLPDDQFIPNKNVDRQTSKQVDGPTSLPTAGLLFGYNEFRGVRKEIRLSETDRRRHTYIIGQTGTGKSGMLENLVVQDMLNGNGLAFIDPHGDTAEKLLSMIPKERSEDVIYFNPADTDYPLGFNLFEFTDPLQKDFIIQESLNMLYKIYDPNGQGTIGPRFEQWYRNAALTLMSDPAGSTFIEIPKVFTDTEYLKRKFRYLKDPTVIEFWTKEMGQTSDYHKSEMLGYFVSKFGAFLQNEMMRNILGQTKSSFNLRDIMDNKKILIVNLSKGQLGEMNSKLLGMMFVIKFQAAAMSRADMLEDERNDFCLYVDEFQNFSTDSFASILSEARKYRLNLIVANQFIGQLTPEIRDAVFGNIGTIVAHRMGPEDAEFMVKQFTPVFEIRDLVNLPNFHAAMRLMVGGLPSLPFTISDLPYLKAGPSELREAIKQLSAAKFGMTRAQVEADIFARLDGKAAPAPKPAPQPAPAPVAPPPAAQPATAPAMAPLPMAVAQTAPTPPKDPSSLSLGDITGGKPAPAVIPDPKPVQPVTPSPTPVPVQMPAPVPVSPPVIAAPAPVTSPLPAASTTPPPASPPPIGAPPLPLAPPPIGAPPLNPEAITPQSIQPKEVPLTPPPPIEVPLVPLTPPVAAPTVPLLTPEPPKPTPVAVPAPALPVAPPIHQPPKRDVPLVPLAPPPPPEAMPMRVVGRPNHTVKHVQGRPAAKSESPQPAPKAVPATPPVVDQARDDVDVIPGTMLHLVEEEPVSKPTPSSIPEPAVEPKPSASVPKHAPKPQPIQAAPAPNPIPVVQPAPVVKPAPLPPQPKPKPPVVQPAPVVVPKPLPQPPAHKPVPPKPEVLIKPEHRVPLPEEKAATQKSAEPSLIHPDRNEKPIASHDNVVTLTEDSAPALSDHHELVIDAPDSLTPKISLDNTSTPTIVKPAKPAGPPEPVIPKLEPGEVYVDELGNVYRGE